MTDRDPRCVYVAQEITLAAALAEWLTGKGYPAEVAQAGRLGEVGDSLGFSEDAPPGLEVRVVKPEHAAPARQLLVDRAEALKQLQEVEARRAARTGTVTAVCEDCGKSSDWPASEMGKTQECPHCGGYMDVPDPDEDWSGVDFEGGEPEDESNESEDEK